MSKNLLFPFLTVFFTVVLQFLFIRYASYEIDKDIEKTIRNLGSIGSEGMRHTDTMILDIMVCK